MLSPGAAGSRLINSLHVEPRNQTENPAGTVVFVGNRYCSSGIHFLPAPSGPRRGRKTATGPQRRILQPRLLRQSQEALSLRSQVRKTIDAATGVGQGGLSLHLLL